MRPMTKRDVHALRLFAGMTLAATIFACGGGSSELGYPRTLNLRLHAINNDTVNSIHILVNNEAYDPSNRVNVVSGFNRQSTVQLTWDTKDDLQTVTVRAGRNGADIKSTTVTMRGDESTKTIRASWDGTNITATLE